MLPEANGALPNGPKEPSAPASGPVGGTGTMVEPKRAISARVAASGSMFAYGMTMLPCASVRMPGVIVIVAGFQNIEDSPPEPAATPAKDSPWAVALCSRMPKAPAWAAVADRKAASATALRARAWLKRFIGLAPWSRCLFLARRRPRIHRRSCPRRPIAAIRPSLFGRGSRSEATVGGTHSFQGSERPELAFYCDELAGRLTISCEHLSPAGPPPSPARQSRLFLRPLVTKPQQSGSGAFATAGAFDACRLTSRPQVSGVG